MPAIPGDQVARRRITADDVPGTLDDHAVDPIRRRGRPGEIRPDVTELDDAAVPSEHDPGPARAAPALAESVDDQSADQARAGLHLQAVGVRSGIRAAQLDHRRSGEALLRRGIDVERIGDHGQRRLQRDGVRAGSRYREEDEVERPGACVRARDGLAQRSGAALEVGRDGEDLPRRIDVGELGVGVVPRVGVGLGSGDAHRVDQQAGRARLNLECHGRRGAARDRPKRTRNHSVLDRRARTSRDPDDRHAGWQRVRQHDVRRLVRAGVADHDVVRVGRSGLHRLGRVRVLLDQEVRRRTRWRRHQTLRELGRPEGASGNERYRGRGDHLSDREARHRFAERGVSAAVGRHLEPPQQPLAFAVARRIARWRREELQLERRRCRAVQ